MTGRHEIEALLWELVVEQQRVIELQRQRIKTSAPPVRALASLDTAIASNAQLADDLLARMRGRRTHAEVANFAEEHR